MPTLSDQVYDYIIQRQLVTTGATVVVGVSGGPDSLCLLHLLAGLRDRLAVGLHVAHLDHRLRGEAGRADAAFVDETARAWGLPATLASVDVAAYASERRLNLHQAAREARYQFLGKLAQTLGAQAIAVAHTASDQAETVLMHLLRGAGTAGLRAMQPAAPLDPRLLHADAPPQTSSFQAQAPGLGPLRIVRPLLATPRAAVERYCAEHGLRPRRDPTNDDAAYTRNRLRHELLPLLASYNQQIVAALGRTASICADEHEFIEQALEARWPQLTRSRPGSVTFDGAAWRALHPALQRAALRRAHGALAPGVTLPWERIEQARRLIGQGVGKRIELPGQVVLTLDYDRFTLGLAPVDGPQLASESLILPVPGSVTLDNGWTIGATYGSARPPADRWSICIDASAARGPLVVRRRRPGDRIRPAGGRGSRLLQDLFVDAKVPRTLRARWPLVEVGGEVIWVIGLRAADGLLPGAVERALWIQTIGPHVEQDSM